MISPLVKTTLSYLFMAVGLLAFVLTTQVVFEWSTAGLKWTTAAACAGTTLLAAVLHYLLRLCQARDGEIRGDATRHERMRSFKFVGLAASLVVGVAIAFIAHKYLQPQEVVSTVASQWHHMTLPDGTAVHVDAHSTVEVAYTDKERMVHVRRGGAVFEVAKDANRPFIARTPIIDAMAVGTRFGVSIDADATTTTVSEGSVKVTSRGRTVTLQGGEELAVSNSSNLWVHRLNVDAERKLQWAKGVLILGGLTVAEGAEQLNRRNRTQIVVENPALGARVVAFASVKVDSPETYAKAVAQEPGVQMIIDRENDVIRLSE